jgi:hypothetical protein
MAKFTLDCEVHHMIAGDANYCWVKRASLELDENISDRKLVRAAKAALGLTGVRGSTEKNGDQWTFRPYGVCAVAFFSVPMAKAPSGRKL